MGHDGCDAGSLHTDHPAVFRRRRVLAWMRQQHQMLIVAAICLLTVVPMWYRARVSAEADLQAHRARTADAARDAIVDQFLHHEQLLHIGRALFDASEEVTREDWRIFVEGLDLPARAPGVLAMGYVARVEPEDRRAFVGAARADGAPDFAIRPHREADLAEHVGPSYVIQFSEPASRNRAAWGVDLATNARNRKVYEQASGANATRMGSGFSLTQARGEGIVMALPVAPLEGRAGKAPTGPEAPSGWITIAVLVEEFLEAARSPQWEGLGVDLRFSEDAADHPGVSTREPEAPRSAGWLRTLVGGEPSETAGALRREFSVFGRTVLLELTPQREDLILADTRDADVVLVVGGLSSALLTIIVWSATRTRRRALAMARQMTESLRISEKRQRELAHRAEQANRAKSEFLANMSHEIRTPMTAILGYAELIDSGELRADADANADPQTDPVQAMRRAGRHLLTIINDVLDLSKIESGHMRLAEEPCDLASLIDDVVSGLRPQAEKKNLRLDARLDEPVPAAVLTDPHRVRQVLINLVGNAVKFTEQGGVRLRVGHRAGRLVVRVEDTGVGIPAGKLEAVFRPFEQADNSCSRRHEGTGLGLTISRRLAELLGGELTATSVVGVGSTFVLDIPAEPAPGAGTIASLEISALPDPAQFAPTALHDSSEPVMRGRVLLAEDGPDNQRLIAFILAKAGLEVEVASNGREAVELVESGRAYDMVITDMQMPEMDGYAAARRLRQLGYARPILALTAHAMEGDRERCLEAGCDDYQTKPVDRAGLLDAVGRMLTRDRNAGTDADPGTRAA